MKRIEMRNLVLLLSSLTLLLACSKDQGVKVQALKPDAGSCNHRVQTVNLITLDSVHQMRGKIGQVVYHPQNVKSQESILDNFEGFKNLRLDLAQSKGTFVPLTAHSLYATSLYYSIEQAYLLFRNLDPSGDMQSLVPDLAATRIVHEARNTLSGRDSEVTDNAQFLGHTFFENGIRKLNNFIFSFPTEENPLPLGLNLGIMVHEYAHMFIRHAFREKFLALNPDAIFSMSDTALWTIQSLDEGFADYAGFLVTKNPSFFLCSFPEDSERDLRTSIETNLPSSFPGGNTVRQHYWGSVFANIQYRIGEKLEAQGLGGHDANGGALVRMFTGLVNCPSMQISSSGVPEFSFRTIKECHSREATSSQMRQIIESEYSAKGL